MRQLSSSHDDRANAAGDPYSIEQNGASTIVRFDAKRLTAETLAINVRPLSMLFLGFSADGDPVSGCVRLPQEIDPASTKAHFEHQMVIVTAQHRGHPVTAVN